MKIAAGAFSLILAAWTAAASTFYVDRHNPTPIYPYDDWATAATNIQYAVNASNDQDVESAVIYVKPGTYTTPTNAVMDRGTNVVRITRPTQLIGVEGPETTIIDGEGVSRGITVRYTSSTHLPFLIEGLTLRNGHGLGIGGGINFAAGGADVGGGTWTGRVHRCVLENNEVHLDGNMALGGGIGSRNYAGPYHLVVTDSEFRGNRTLPLGNANATGGGIYLRGTTQGSLFVDNCLFEANAGTRGGGIHRLNGTLVLLDSILRDNQALEGTDNDDAEGAVNLSGGEALVRNCLIYNNVSDQRAGGVFTASTGTPRYSLTQIESSTIVSNQSGSGGTGIHQRFEGSWLVVTNSIIAYNMRAGIYRDNVIYSTEGTGLTHRLAYSCVYPDSPQALGEYIEHLTVEPKFADFENQDFRLAHDSPNIDSGIHFDWMTGATDLDGRPRIGGEAVDRGCFEYHPPGTVLLIR